MNAKFLILIAGFLLIGSNPVLSQIFLFDFGTVGSTGNYPGDCSNIVTIDNAVGTPTFQLSSGLTNTTFFTGSDSECNNFTQTSQCARSAQTWTANNQYYQVTASTTNYSTMTFSACMRSSAGTNAGEFQLRVSTDGNTWTDVGGLYSFIGTGVDIISISEMLPASAGVDNQPTVYFQLFNSGADVQSTAVRVDKVQLIGTSLPIELANFNAQPQGNTVLVSWKTLSEHNNAYIAIERSANGIGFETIGRQDGAGNSLQVKEYRFIDQNPFNGTNYYRLKQFDTDGTSTYSHIITVQVKSANIKVSPTTVHSGESISLDLSEITGEITVQVIDINGINVGQYQFEANTIAEFGLPTLSSGTYFLHIHASNTNTTKKLIILD